jgi:hypothetical protein
MLASVARSARNLLGCWSSRRDSGRGPVRPVARAPIKPGALQPGTLQPGTLQPGTLQPGTLQPRALQRGAHQDGSFSPVPNQFLAGDSIIDGEDPRLRR